MMSILTSHDMYKGHQKYFMNISLQLSEYIH